MLAFFLYCALEGTTGLWASSFLVLRHNIAAESAASMASLFYIGITAGRFLSGFISDKLGDRRMVSIGIVCVLFGTVLLFVPVEFSAVAGLVFIGLGCAPVYPGLLHQTPVRFGAENAQAVMGMQMACAYVGSMTMPGVLRQAQRLARYADLSRYPHGVCRAARLCRVERKPSDARPQITRRLDKNQKSTILRTVCKNFPRPFAFSFFFGKSVLY